MKCAWQELLNIIPPQYRNEVDRQGRANLWEFRMRLGMPPEMVGTCGTRRMTKSVEKGDIQYVINGVTGYSPWAAKTASQGYLTAPGGHRIGICGSTVMNGADAVSIKEPTSLCIRVARDHPGIAKGLPDRGSVLIIGRPGGGKTTLLRDFIRQRSYHRNRSVSVVDERGELFPASFFDTGPKTDVLSGCTKSRGVEMLLRTMGPGEIAVDEITSASDCDVLLQSGWCGVELLATAHAADREDLFRRPVYRPLLEQHLFDWLVILQEDKSWHLERM